MPPAIEKSALLTELQRLADEVGQAPTTKQMREHGKHTPDPYQRAFGSWKDALREAGFDPSRDAHNRIPTAELLAELRRLADELGRPPTSGDMVDYGKFGTAVYCRRFGGWVPAQIEAGLEPTRAPEDVSRDELIEELRRLADIFDRAPTSREMDKTGWYSALTYERRFGSWIQAQKAADLEPSRRPPGEGESAHYLGNWSGQREKALERDGYCCQVCGVADQQYSETHNIGLDVHHKVPYEEFDDPREAHEVENLVSLCRECHHRRHQA